MEFGKKLKIFFRGKMRTRHSQKYPMRGVRHYVMIDHKKVTVPTGYRSPRNRRKSPKRRMSPKCTGNSSTCPFANMTRSRKTCHCRNQKGYKNGVKYPTLDQLRQLAVAHNIDVLTPTGRKQKAMSSLRASFLAKYGPGWEHTYLDIPVWPSRAGASVSASAIVPAAQAPITPGYVDPRPFFTGVSKPLVSSAGGAGLPNMSAAVNTFDSNMAQFGFGLKKCRGGQFRSPTRQVRLASGKVFERRGRCRSNKYKPCPARADGVVYKRSPTSRKCYPEDRALRKVNKRQLFAIAGILGVSTRQQNGKGADGLPNYFKKSGKPTPELKSMSALKNRFTKQGVPYPGGPPPSFAIRNNGDMLRMWNKHVADESEYMRADASRVNTSLSSSRGFRGAAVPQLAAPSLPSNLVPAMDFGYW